MRLREDLWHECVVIEVFDVVHLSAHLVVLMSSLIDVTNKVFVLEIDAPELLVIVCVWIERRRCRRPINLLHIVFSNLTWWDRSRSHREHDLVRVWLSIFGVILLAAVSWLCRAHLSSEAMRRWRVCRLNINYTLARKVDFLSGEVDIRIVIDIVRMRVGKGVWSNFSALDLRCVSCILIYTVFFVLAHRFSLVIKMQRLLFLFMKFL